MSTYKGVDDCTDIILDFIAGGVPGNPSGESDGNYNAVIGDAGASDDLGAKTITDIYALMDARLAAGMPSTAIGRYQIIRATLKASLAALSLGGDVRFTPELQDHLGLKLMVGRGYSSWFKGTMTDEDFAHGLSLEWASLPDPGNGGKSHYDGVGPNHASTTLAVVYAMLAKARAARAAPAAPVVPPPVPDTSPAKPPLPAKVVVGTADVLDASVRLLQTVMTVAGYYAGPIDGRPNAALAAALDKYGAWLGGAR